MRAKFGRDPMAGSKKVTLKFIIGFCPSFYFLVFCHAAFHSGFMSESDMMYTCAYTLCLFSLSFYLNLFHFLSIPLFPGSYLPFPYPSP